MRRSIWPALLLFGCSCGNEESARDAGLDAAPDAARDAAEDREGADAATDARVDAPDVSGPCPEGETPVEPFAIPHEGEGASCGKGCRQITWDPRGVGSFDLDGVSLAYASVDDVTIGLLDLETGEEIGFTIEDPDNEELATLAPVTFHTNTIAYSSFPTDGSKRGWLWRVDTTTMCRRLLRELQSPGGVSLDVADGVDLSDETIVWTDGRWGLARQDVFAYDLAADIELRLTTDGCCVGQTRIAERRVVYHGWADGQAGIHLIELPDGEPTRVWPDGHEQMLPAIQGHRVVFTYQGDRPRYDWDVHGVDLDTGEHFVVVEGDGCQQFADVFGDLVVWEDCRNDPELDPGGGTPDNIDIYGKDLATGKELPVVTLPGLQVRPRVWNRRVFFLHIASEEDPIEVYAVDLQ